MILPRSGGVHVPGKSRGANRRFDRYVARLHAHGEERQRVLLAERASPGMDGYQAPKAVAATPERLRDRRALYVVGLPEVGAVPERFGLGAAIFARGGLVYDAEIVHPDDLDAQARAQLERWCATHRVDTVLGPRRWRLLSLTEFSREVLFRRAYWGRCLVAGADLGRSFGLFAKWWRPVKRKRRFRDGWQLGLPVWGVIGEDDWVQNTGTPRVYLGQRARRSLAVEFGSPRRSFEGEPWGVWERRPGTRGPDDAGVPYRGRFVELIATAFALDAIDSDDLADHLPAWGIEAVEPHVVRPDAEGAAHLAAVVRAQHALAVALDAEAARWGLSIATQLHSPGTVSDRAVVRAGVAASLTKFCLPAAELGAWCRTSHGGLVEANVVGRLVPGADFDQRSAHPTNAHALGWWDLMTAERVCTRRRTREFRRFITQPAAVLRDAMHVRSTWRYWGFMRVRLRAHGASLPVEVVDEHDRSRTHLVAHPVEGEVDLTWLDAVAAVARDGETRFEILEAVQVVPEGRQSGLGEIATPFGALPADEDPVPALVAERERCKRRAAAHPADYEAARRVASVRMFLNTLVYGNPARVDPLADGGGKPGPWWWAPLASCVSAAARCMGAVVEADVRDAGGALIAYDTDGGLVTASPHGGETVDLGDGRHARALSYAELDTILAGYDALSADGGPWGTVTRGNQTAPSLALCRGPKRWGLMRHTPGGAFEALDEHQPDDTLDAVLDHTEHVLGGHVPPPTMRHTHPDGRGAWTAEVVRADAQRVADGARGLGRLAFEHGDGGGFPALDRRQPPTPEEAAKLPAALGPEPYGPRPFCRVVWANPSGGFDDARPVALDPGGDCADWRSWTWLDARTNKPTHAVTDPRRFADFHGRGPAVLLDTLADRAMRWADHEPWPLPEVIVRDPTLVLSVVRAGSRYLAGLGDEERSGAEAADLLVEAAGRAGPGRLPALAALVKLPKRTVRGWTTRRPQGRTVERALVGLAVTLGTRSLAALLDAIDGTRTCEVDECTETVAGKARFCPNHRHRRRAEREADRRRRRADEAWGWPCACGRTISVVEPTELPWFCDECIAEQHATEHPAKALPCERCGERLVEPPYTVCAGCVMAAADEQAADMDAWFAAQWDNEQRS
jgi:hypothetical protein